VEARLRPSDVFDRAGGELVIEGENLQAVDL
jgi:hypothetical protein